MQRPARLPEFFDQIAQNIPVLEFGSRPPPPENLNLGRSWHLGFDFPEHPPPPPLKIEI